MSQETGRFHKAQLMEKLEDLKDDWVSGAFTGESTEETIQKNSEALGKAQAYADVILTLEEMQEDESDEQDIEA